MSEEIVDEEVVETTETVATEEVTEGATEETE